MANQFAVNPQNNQWSQQPMNNMPVQPNNYSYGQYLQWVQQQQQAQAAAAQQAQAMAVRGRIVNSERDITARDVSMDGYSFFPQNDESCIYVKCWNSSGTIDTKRYIPEPNPQQTAAEQQNEFNTAVGKALENISNRLTEIEKRLFTAVPTSNDGGAQGQCSTITINPPGQATSYRS